MTDEGPVELQEPLEELARDPRRFGHDLVFPPADRIRVYDDTLRDGEQMPGVAFSPLIPHSPARRGGGQHVALHEAWPELVLAASRPVLLRAYRPR